MRRLIIMRHAKTERWFEGVNDSARALIERGHEDAVMVAEEMVARNWVPDHVYVSTARRANETWARIKPFFLHSEVTKKDELYLASLDTLLDIVGDIAVEDTAMIIGHNPGLHELALHYWARDVRAEFPPESEMLDYKLPTSGAVLIEFGPGENGEASVKLAGMIYPKALRI